MVRFSETTSTRWKDLQENRVLTSFPVQRQNKLYGLDRHCYRGIQICIGYIVTVTEGPAATGVAATEAAATGEAATAAATKGGSAATGEAAIAAEAIWSIDVAASAGIAAKEAATGEAVT